MANSLISNVLTRVINSLMEGVNKHRLPRFIIMLLDRDILMGIKAENRPGVSKKIGSCISWLTKQIELIINIKKEEIFNKRMGALQPDEPKVIWIKMMERPSASQNDETLQQKFNDILEETLVSRPNNLILDIKEALQKSLFDRTGYLTGVGKIKFWQEVDQLTQQFDKQEVTLLPRPVVTNSRVKSDSKIHPFSKKLPTPPPRARENSMEFYDFEENLSKHSHSHSSRESYEEESHRFYSESRRRKHHHKSKSSHRHTKRDNQSHSREYYH